MGSLRLLVGLLAVTTSLAAFAEGASERAAARPVAAGSSSIVGPRATSAWAELCAPRQRGRRVVVKPGVDLARLARAKRPGTLFCIRAGVHRVRGTIVPKSRQSFIGQPGAVLSGAKDIASQFVRSGSHWVASGQSQRNPSATGQCEERAPTCVHPNDVFVDGKRLRRVQDLEGVRRGTFFFDHDAQRIWIGVDPRGRRVEASAGIRAFSGWRTDASDVVIRGLVIEKFANEGSSGAVQAGDGWTIDANEIRLNHAIGLQGGHVVTKNNIHHNGQLGFATHGTTGTLFAGNEVAYNNTLDYDWDWEAGGTKFMVTRNLTVRNNYVHHNRSGGMSTDWDNIGTLYEGNRVEDNLSVGILHEASYDAVIRSNVVRRNGFAMPSGFDGAGINITESQNVEVVGNTIDGNLHGVGVVESERSDGRYGRHDLKNVHVHHNSISLRRSIGASGLASDDAADYTSNNNRFQSNRYTYCQARAFAWARPGGGYQYVTKDEWVAAGNDTTGSFRRTNC